MPWYEEPGGPRGPGGRSPNGGGLWPPWNLFGPGGLCPPWYLFGPGGRPSNCCPGPLLKSGLAGPESAAQFSKADRFLFWGADPGPGLLGPGGPRGPLGGPSNGFLGPSWYDLVDVKGDSRVVAAKGAFVRARVAERFVAAGARAVRRPGAHRLAFMVRGYMKPGQINRLLGRGAASRAGDLSWC